MCQSRLQPDKMTKIDSVIILKSLQCFIITLLCLSLENEWRRGEIQFQSSVSAAYLLTELVKKGISGADS